MIRLQFSTSLEMSSGIIRRICHSPFSHVDVLSTDDQSCVGASNSPHAPIVVSSPAGNAGGVAWRPRDYQEFGIRRVAELSVDPAVEQAFDTLMDGQLGKPFDGDALYAMLSPDVSTERDWRVADKWFCSELVTWCLEQAGVFPYPLLVSKNRVTPADLLLLISPYVSNAATFWQPVAGLTLGKHEQ